METKSFWGEGNTLRRARIKAKKYAVDYIKLIKKSQPQLVITNVKYKFGDVGTSQKNEVFINCIVTWKQGRRKK